jgi:hypothetical protein
VTRLEVPAFARLPEFLVDLRRHAHRCRYRLHPQPPQAPAVADMDSTMIHQECIDELGVMAGWVNALPPSPTKAMRGELDFEGA